MPALLSRALVVGASAVLLVSVAACAPDRPTSTPVPTGSSSPRGDATASDAPVASPSASAQPGITAQSLGGYALGSPLTAAARSLGAEVAGASCPWAFTARSAWETWLLADPDAADPTDTIALIAIAVYSAQRRRNEELRAAAAKAAPNPLADPMLVATGIQLARAIGVKKLIPILALGGLALGLMARRDSSAKETSDE